MKVTFMGAGSTVFSKNVLGDSMLCEAFHDMEIALYDIDADELKRVFDVVTHKELVEVVNERYGNKEGLVLFQGMLDKEQMEAMDQVFRDEFEDANRSEYGRKPTDAPYRRKHHKDVDSAKGLDFRPFDVEW